MDGNFQNVFCVLKTGLAAIRKELAHVSFFIKRLYVGLKEGGGIYLMCQIVAKVER